MRLMSIHFVEHPGADSEWILDTFNLSEVNLIVGRNSTGKTRTINIISNIAKMITGDIKEVFYSGSCSLVFKRGEDIWEYHLEYNNFQVTREHLVYRGQKVLHRGAGGLGRIQAEDIEGRAVEMKFKVPDRELAVVKKRDSAQHSFLEPLHEWAAALRLFSFGGEMNPLNLAIAFKGPKVEVNEKQTAQVVPIFHKAINEFGDDFKRSVIKDMSALGYNLTALDIRRPSHTQVVGLIPGDVVGVSASEAELRVPTDQPFMSQGMFRSLSLLIQTTYYALKRIDGCILIDDIGDGLDFERSCILIDILREKAHRSSFQLIMSSNNRFVMNRVPLEEWCVLQRRGNLVSVRNYANSREAFEKFKLTGLNNFDLLATNYLGSE